jgi:hypothetical protein
MAKWKPTYYRTNGRPGATAPLRRVATKLLEQMKHRNEELGNYANPVQRVRHGDTKYMLSSLPGYDIVDITVPFEEEEEVGGKADIYSGLWEPTFQSHSLLHYLRWYPSGYELYNSDSATPAGLGASVDGAADRLLPAFMPPNRWMQNDYTYDPEDEESKEEAPWFKDTGPVVSATSIHPGKYSGKLRELVQMQLGYGLLPQFSYSASNSNGIHLETLDEDTTRIWLYQISATNGVVMQIMMDYSGAKFEEAADLKPGEIPPEIEEAGFMALQTSFDSTKPVYTKAEWDALSDAERPPINAVTFVLLSAASYLSATSEYGAYGDYGWSFNPAGTSAVIVGMAWNTPGGGGLAVNYKANLLTVTLNPTAFSASVSGSGDQPFLMDSSFDHVKFPNPDGTLETVYFWKGENGLKGTQPSASYTAPIYAYYDLNGDLVQCDYEWVDGTAATKNGGSAFPLTWTETVACRQATTWQPTNFHYKACSTGESGTGTWGCKHGFNTKITTPDSYNVYTGYAVKWAQVHAFGYKDQSIWYNESFSLNVLLESGLTTDAWLNIDEHYYERKEGSFSGSTKSVLIVPSFERLAFYHYKNLNTTITTGKVQHPHTFAYERGAPVRQNGRGGALGDDCTYAGCGWAIFGTDGSQHPELETAPEYYLAKTVSSFTRMLDIYPACSPVENLDCFGSPTLDVYISTPADQDPYSEDNNTYVGGCSLPNGGSIAFSEDEIVNDSDPFGESSASFGYQSVVSCFDTFSGKYIFSMPNIAMTDRKHTADGFPDDIVKVAVLFSGMPYFIG